MSAKMLGKARAAGYYDELVHSTILDYASSAAPRSFDVIVAGDVLGAIGRLDKVLKALHRLLKPGGCWHSQ